MHSKATFQSPLKNEDCLEYTTLAISLAHTDDLTGQNHRDQSNTSDQR